MIQVSFQHWRHEFTEEILTRCGGPYLSKKEAGAAFMSDIYARAERVTSIESLFSYSHVICANEAFPESAVSDPIADL